eukprot:2540351-Karenia_brevis.AAC.1
MSKQQSVSKAWAEEHARHYDEMRNKRRISKNYSALGCARCGNRAANVGPSLTAKGRDSSLLILREAWSDLIAAGCRMLPPG